MLGYLDSSSSLAEEAAREGRRRVVVVVVLDNAPLLHEAGAIRDARAGWEMKGLELYYLAAYWAHPNLIEGV